MVGSEEQSSVWTYKGQMKKGVAVMRRNEDAARDRQLKTQVGRRCAGVESEGAEEAVSPKRPCASSRCRHIAGNSSLEHRIIYILNFMGCQSELQRARLHPRCRFR